MSDCLKCSYVKGEPKGSRVCRKCNRPENVPKGQFNPHGWLEKQPVEPLREVGQARPLSATTPGNPVTSDVPSATAAGLTPILPPHSRMGGSAAHRFLNCPGSTALIAGLKMGESDDPDWTRDGTVAHALGARCLEEDADAWELVSQFPLPPDQASAVQEYIDEVRSLPGHRRVEVKLHLPELHPLMFSTLDVILDHVLGRIALTVLDYKHGEGVYVEVVENEQLMYYACMAIMERPQDFDDTDNVLLGICQPRCPWADDTTRWWETTVGYLKAWLYDVLLPAMRLEAQNMHLQMGEWCRFCPAKLVCPAMSQALAAFAGATDELATLSDEVLGRDYALTATVKMRIRAVEGEVYRRRMEGVDVPGSKLVSQKTDWVWKDDAPIVERWHQDAWQPLKMISPAQAEKLPEGKAFVSEWAYKPEAGYTVALADDPRAAVVLKTPEQKYGDLAKFAVDIGKLV